MNREYYIFNYFNLGMEIAIALIDEQMALKNNRIIVINMGVLHSQWAKKKKIFIKKRKLLKKV